MDPLTALKSLTDKHLGDSADDLGDPTALLGTPLVEPYPNTSKLSSSLKTDMRNGVLRLENSVYGKGKEAQRKLAWRCLRCNTINGLQGGSYTKVRKTCTKCAQPRKNEFTVEQELLIDFLVSEGWSVSQAIEKMTNNGVCKAREKVL